MFDQMTPLGGLLVSLAIISSAAMNHGIASLLSVRWRLDEAAERDKNTSSERHPLSTASFWMQFGSFLAVVIIAFTVSMMAVSNGGLVYGLISVAACATGTAVLWAYLVLGILLFARLTAGIENIMTRSATAGDTSAPSSSEK